MRITRMTQLALLMIFGISSIALAQTQYTFTSIASLDSYAGYMEPATITNRGDVLFAPALLTGGEGVVLWRSGVLTTIAAAGDAMPDGGVLGYTLSPVQMNEQGEVAFIMTRNYLDVPPPTGFNAGVYRYNARTGIVPVMVPGLAGHGGDAFWGSTFIVSINPRGDVYFPGMVCTSVPASFDTQPCPNDASKVLTFGVYRADVKGKISPVVAAGDAAPGGSYFDYTLNAKANANGDVAFAGHVFADPCLNRGLIFCNTSLFLKKSPSGVVVPIARVGSPSPISGRNYQSAYTPIINSAGAIAFIADTSLSGDFSEQGVFLYRGGKTVIVAKAGDEMPGGGYFAFVGAYNQDIDINNNGDVVFDATLTDNTQGIYLWRHGGLSLVAKTGTDTGAGIISSFDDFGGGVANTQVSVNDAGRILFAARFEGGGGALLVATPK